MKSYRLLSSSLLACLLVCATISLPAWAQTGNTIEWTWVSGDSIDTECNIGGCVTIPGVWGTLGVPAAANDPGSRISALSWTDSKGNLWLFGGGGGISSVEAYVGGYLDDLWEYNPSTQQWAWMAGTSGGGDNFYAVAGVYGTMGTPAAGNTPGGRTFSVNWTDGNGNLWLFGGATFDTGGQPETLNDLWEFNPSTSLWAWMGGSNTPNPSGVYGTLGMPAAGNIPGGRSGSVAWTDKSGNLWVLGGCTGTESGGAYLPNTANIGGYLNDLWEFEPSSNEWAWMGGSNTVNPSGSYGTLGTAAAGNIPGGRTGSVSWTDGSGNFWLFGGQGIDSAGNTGLLNDLWKFNPSSNEWTWMGGSNAANSTGAYGTLGTPAAGNIPGGRGSSVTWTDGSGNFWLFGGQGIDSAGNTGYLNDLWEFDPSSNGWTWTGGYNTVNQFGEYGTMGTPAAANIPGARAFATSWTLPGGNFWFYGGGGLGAYVSPASFDSGYGLPDDLWHGQLSTVTYPTAATPAFSVAGGTYSATQNVTLSDATAGSTIYFTTDGSTPTTSSTVASFANNPIVIDAAESPMTVKSIAAANNYLTSAVASATYTIVIPPPGFTVAVAPSSYTMTPGNTGTGTVTVTSQNGFNAAVSFSCTGLPSGATCGFAPATVTPSGSTAGTTDLTVTVPATSAALHRAPGPLFPGAALAALALCFSWKKRRRLQMLLLLAVSIAGLSLLNACGGGSSSTPPPVNYTITLTAASGSLSQTTTFTLTVD
jgi:N-acetylneuraminic acid mutarotase